MVRLDVLVARVLADARQRMNEEKDGAAVEAAPQVPRGVGRKAKCLAGGRDGRRVGVHPASENPHQRTTRRPTAAADGSRLE